MYASKMFKCTVTFFLLIQFAYHVNYSQQQLNNLPQSPCPHVFEYEYDGNEWFGVITVSSPRLDQKEVILHLALSLRASTTVSIGAGAERTEDGPQEEDNGQRTAIFILLFIVYVFSYILPIRNTILHVFMRE